MKYHASIYLPRELISVAKMQAARWVVRYSQHARQKADERCIHLPTRFPAEAAELIELETDNNGTFRKSVWRSREDETHDLCWVMRFDGLCITLYRNRRDDHHATLDRRGYAAVPRQPLRGAFAGV